MSISTRKKRRIRLAAALLATTALILSACGGGDTAAPAPVAPPAPSGGGQAEAPAPVELSGDPVVIGVLWPQTGPTALTGNQVWNAVQMAIEEANAEGGIDGRPIKGVVYDDEGRPERSAELAQRAISSDGVVAVIGTHATTTGLAVMDIFEREEVPIIHNSAATPVLTADKQFAFRTAPLTPDLASGLADIAKALAPTGRVALIHDDGGFALGTLPFIREAAARNQIELIVEVEYPTASPDLSAQITALVRSRPEVVIIAGSQGADHGLVGRQMVEQGLLVPLVGFSPISFRDAVEIAGPAYDQLPGVYTLQTVDVTNPEFQSFLDRYNASFSPVQLLPEMVGAGYDATRILIEALRATGGEGGTALRDALYGVGEVKVKASGRATSSILFEPGNHNGQRGSYLSPYILKGGKLEQALDISF
jgi:branched-chain amino acid transport system substrate-binding protein